MAPRRRSTRRRRDEEPESEPEAEQDVEVEQLAPEEPAAEEEDDTPQDEANEPRAHGTAPVTLSFNEPLTWRPGKPIPSGQLLARLRRLFEELSELDQDTVDKNSLVEVATALAQRNMLQQKDPGVKAYAACCLVEILQLCAPDAPFTEDQLKMIFSLFITSSLASLQDPTNTYHAQHKHVLSSLSEVKSILLLSDLDGADELLLQLFTCCFDTISTLANLNPDGEAPKDIEYRMCEMMITLIDESGGIPANVVETVVAQFLRAAPGKTGGKGKTDQFEQNGSQSTLLPKSEPAAYVVAKTICNTVPEKMARYVSQFFSDVIMDASSLVSRANGHRNGDDGDDDVEDAPAGPTEKELENLRRTHTLIKEIWRAAPLVLQNVVPQVEVELSTDNVDLRLIATETFGYMLSGIGAAGPPPLPVLDPCAYPPMRLLDDPPPPTSNSVLTTPMCSLSFIQTYPTAYQAFVGRKNDKSPVIRAAWTTAAGHIVSTSGGGIGLGREEEALFVSALAEKLNDSDERVRLMAVKTVELFTFRDVITKLGPYGGVSKQGSFLANLADRCRDKRPAVRVEAMVVLGRLWSVAAAELASGQEAVTSCLSGISSRIFNVFYANDQDLNILLDRVVFECLVPLGFPPRKGKAVKGSVGSSSSFDPDKIRAERILFLVQSLDETARKAFFAMQTRQPQFAKVAETFIRQCETYNGGTMDGDEARTQSNLNKTAMYVGQFFPDAQKVRADLLKFAKANDRRNYQLVKFAVGSDNDFKTVHGAIKELIKRIQASQSASILDTMIPLLYRSACIMFNRSHLSTIMDYSKSDKDGLGSVSHDILGEISQRNPGLFKSHVGELCKSLLDQVPTERKENDPSVVDMLKACSSYAQKYPTEIPHDKAFTNAMLNYANYVRPPRGAKYAVNILLAKKDEKSMVHATSLLQKIMQNWEYDTPFLLNKLVAVSQLALNAPKVVLDYDDEILNLAVQQILLQVRTDATEKDPTWVDDANMDEEIQAKCICLKILASRVRATEDPEEAKKKAKPLFKLLRTLILKDGEVCKEKATPKHHRSRLLLLAAQLTLKLCMNKVLDDLLSPLDFDQLAFVAQRGEQAVRHRFLEKLQKYLSQRKLRARFYTILFLTAFEPVSAFKQRIETWIRARSHEPNDQQVLEAIMGRLLSLLAHHPDYSNDLDNLVDHARYLLFYVSNVATESNIGLIYRYAERVKQTRDAIEPEKSENLYVLSDLAQSVIRKWQEKRNWSFQAWPGKIGLPTGLYAILPSHEAAQEIAQKQYTPDGLDEKLDDLIRVLDRKKKRKSMDERSEPPTKKLKAAIRTAKMERPKERSRAPKPSQPKKATKAKPSRRKRAEDEDSPTRAAVSAAERRRSGRVQANASYTERDSSEDDEEMLEGVAEWEYLDGSDGDKDDVDSESEKNNDSTGGSPEESAAEEEEPVAQPSRTRGKASTAKLASREKPVASRSSRRKRNDSPVEDDD